MSNDKEKLPPLRTRVAWMIAIWCASVAALGLGAYLMRLTMRLAGLST